MVTERTTDPAAHRWCMSMDLTVLLYYQTSSYVNGLFFHSTVQYAMAQDQWTSFTLLAAALLLYTLSYSSAENAVYCVTPTHASCSSCPQNSAHCTTLSEYAHRAELYYTSNTTMRFLPGDHTLNINITISNLTRLTMHGESAPRKRATVICNVSIGLSFTSIVKFEMYSSAFTSCSRKNSVLPARNYALLLQSIWYAELVNCFFYDNHGTALVVRITPALPF